MHSPVSPAVRSAGIFPTDQQAFPQLAHGRGLTAARTMATIPALTTSGKAFHASITTFNRGGGKVSVVLLLCSVMLVLCSSAVLWSSGEVRGSVPWSTSGPLLSLCPCPGCDMERPVQDSVCPIPVLSELVEAGGIEPPSRGISAEASTCVFHLLAFLGPRDSDGQDSLWARARTDEFPQNPSGRRIQGSLLLSPVPVPQAKPDRRRRQLSGESVVLSCT